MSQLFEMIRALAQSVALLTSKVNLVTNSSQLASTPNNGFATRESLYTEFQEFEERKKRKDSLIVRGIVASNDDEFRAIFGRVSNIVMDTVLQPDNVYRIPSQSNMFRIKITDTEARRKILLNAKKLKDHENFKNVYISRDLTFVQRQEFRANRAQFNRNPHHISGGPFVDSNVVGNSLSGNVAQQNL